MVYPVHVVHVLIASPSDVAAERTALREAIWEFNDEHTPANKVVLLPRTWEKNSTPRLGAAPQDILDEQIVDSSDIAIGIFWTRIGQLLEDGTPASVHELERFVAADKPALLYFSNTPVIPGSIDNEQFEQVQKFKERAKSWGIYREYSGVEELVQHARRDLLSTVRDQLNLPQVTEPVATSQRARPVARVERRESQRFDSRGNPKVDRRTYLILENKGGGGARNVKLAWDHPAEDRNSIPLVHGAFDAPINSLVAGGHVEFALSVMSGVLDRVELRVEWEDDDGPHSQIQTIVM
ncbi:hypothetical protein VXD82_13965 [Mycobacteroides chelonae]|uniref:hypothetical protein n=1 Tax=Mycobacteroides chelonae TaxID=1774 RepID=UPI003204C6D8